MSRRTRSTTKSIDSKLIKVEPDITNTMNSNKVSKLALSALSKKVKAEKLANDILNKSVKKEIKVEIKTEPGTKWEPLYWRKQLNNIRTMRAKKDAPVDTMGCERTNQELTEKVNSIFFSIIKLL